MYWPTGETAFPFCCFEATGSQTVEGVAMSYVAAGNGACKSLLSLRRARLAHRRAIRAWLPAAGQPDHLSFSAASAMANEARVFCKDQSAHTQFEAALANQVLVHTQLGWLVPAEHGAKRAAMYNIHREEALKA
jgi:hypothetical protein